MWRRAVVRRPALGGRGGVMITAELLRDWGACWPDSQIRERMGTRESVTPRDVAADESISLDDRLWVLCRSIWYLDEHAARMFAVESASLVVHLAGDEDDQAQYRGILNWLCEIEDLPEDKRDVARVATWVAAWDAARDAAWAAARAAAWTAARAAAWTAARDEHLRSSISRALHWLGDYADGWEADSEQIQEAA